MAGIDRVPALIRAAGDKQMLELALVENILREDLNPIDRAKAYRRYCDEFQVSPQQLAQITGDDRTTVTNYLRLLDLPDEVKDWVAQDRLAMGHARCLLAIKSTPVLIRTAREAIEKDLSVRAVEQLVRERADAKDRAKTGEQTSRPTKRPQIRHLEQQFVQLLGTKVEISESRRKGSGKITIHYYTLDDFDRISKRLGLEV
jgi:ParB family chromosome partitioning protein